MSAQPLSLSDVLNLGGDKSDLELLKGVDQADEAFDTGMDDNDEGSIGTDEVRNFMKGLGFAKLKMADLQVLKDEDVQGDELEENEKSTVESKPSAEKPEPKSKKKTKNKFKLQDDEISSTTEVSATAKEHKPIVIANIDFTNRVETRTFILIKLMGKWYEQFSSDPQEFSPVDKATVSSLRNYAIQLMKNETLLYKKSQEKKGGEARWIGTVMKSGTLSDKVAAHTLQVQNSPVHSMSNLDTLLNMLKAKSKREPLLVIDPLKELFLELLPEQKLRTFEQHPLAEVEQLASGNNDTRDRRLILWLYEEQLKERYASFVEVLQTLLKDQLVSLKMRVLGVAHSLLTTKPELENVLLTTLVNKLGDPQSKTAAKATSLLIKLVEQHPAMKQIVVADVERMLYRPNLAERAQYYGICFLNQILLTRSDTQVASKLVTIYFTFFKEYAKKAKSETKMLAALLTGVNRAYPFAKMSNEAMKEEVSTLYKTAGTATFNTAIQALMLLQHTARSGDSVCDRFYTALYRKLLDSDLAASSKQALFLNLVYKSLLKDDNIPRVKAFIKRLLQVCLSMKVAFICGTLVLLSELVHSKQSEERGLLTTNASACTQSSALEDSESEDEHFVDVDEDKSDASEKSPSKTNKDDTHEEKSQLKASWIHRKKVKVIEYDPQFRNPLGCHAERECVWELKELANHFHPTVAMFSKQLIEGKRIKYRGDPLQDFTLIKFLDRFVFKNPKKSEKAAALSRKVSRTGTISNEAVNTEKFLEKREKDVPVHERFFFRYFQENARRRGKPEKADDDGSDVSDDEFDDFLDDYEKRLEGRDAAVTFDFASELDRQKRVKNAKGKDVDDEEDESDDDLGDLDDLSDEEIDFGDDEEFAKAFDSEDDENTNSSEGDEEGRQLDGEEDDDGWESDEPMDDGSHSESGSDVGVTQLMADDGEDFDEDRLAFSDNEEEEDDDQGFMTLGDFQNKTTKQIMKTKRKTEPRSVPLKKRKQSDGEQLYMAAEELSSIMDENVDSKYTIGTQAVSTKDNANVKQLNWEANRDQWTNNQDWRSRKNKGKGSFGKHPKTKRTNPKQNRKFKKR